MRVLALILAALLPAGCTTPYPDGTPIHGATVDANRAPRGSERFCRTYARQTAANAFEANRDSADRLGVDLIEAQRARDEGVRAYARCRAGRTG